MGGEKTGALSEAQIRSLVESVREETVEVSAEVATRVALDAAAKILDVNAAEIDKARIRTASEPKRRGAETALRAVAADMREAAKALRAAKSPGGA